MCLICNTSVIVQQTDDRFCSCEEKSEKTIPLDEMEALVYSILNERLEKGADTFFDNEIAIKIYIRKGFITEKELQNEI